MKATIPPDLDLEDPLLFGLDSQHSGYALLALLSVLALWKSGLPAPLRILVVLPTAAGGAILSWGRWRSRPADAWIADMVRFGYHNYRLELPGWLTVRFNAARLGGWRARLGRVCAPWLRPRAAAPAASRR
ncbi:MAG TPA: hypothetical protein VNI34_02205 [Candidatus Nitrosotalea sp.]|nr:hypothetical protein [Candidatus Nitrosotalea sp.]